MERWEEEVIWEDSIGLSWTDRNLMNSLRGQIRGMGTEAPMLAARVTNTKYGTAE